MITRKKKTRKGNSLQSLIFGVLLTVLVLGTIGFLIFYNFKIYKKRISLQDRVEALKAEINILEKRSQELREGISQAGQEGFLEEAAREQFNLKKPGEEVITVLPPEEEKEQQEPEEKKVWWNPFTWW